MNAPDPAAISAMHAGQRAVRWLDRSADARADASSPAPGFAAARANPSASECRLDASRCRLCNVRRACPSDPDQDPGAVIAVPVFRKVPRGSALYRAGDEFHDFYRICSGSFKLRLTSASGREQIPGFPIVGDFLGLDGIESGQHGCDAIALEDSQVCAIPFSGILARCRQDAGAQDILNRLFAGEITRERRLLMAVGCLNADSRLAVFLADLSGRLAARGYSGREFHLRMTREDIGNHLGMKLETVSRSLARLQAEGTVSVRHKHLEIRNPSRLTELSAA